MAGTSPDQAAKCLEALYGEGLLTETGYRRYGMHDLIRRYARDLAAGTPVGSNGQALGRLLDYYQHAAGLASKYLARVTFPGRQPAAAAAFEVPGLDGAGPAMAWFRAEGSNLLACLDLATRTGQHARVVALTADLAAMLYRYGPWAEALTRHAAAVDAARRLGDQLGEANALFDLGLPAVRGRRLFRCDAGSAGSFGHLPRSGQPARRGERPLSAREGQSHG